MTKQRDSSGAPKAVRAVVGDSAPPVRMARQPPSPKPVQPPPQKPVRK
ncbi:hypothetical protein ACVKN3_001692 [Luteibacter sp. PvP120]